jgi:hypothetical protein
LAARGWGGEKYLVGRKSRRVVDIRCVLAAVLRQAQPDLLTGGVGSGIRNSGASVTLYNTILANNTASTAYTADWAETSAQSASSHNLIGIGGSVGLSGGNLVGSTTTPWSPGLTTLGSHGGPTQTHALLETSDAIDAGNNAVAVAYGLFQDQRGGEFGQIVDWDDDESVDTIDIGALELAFDEEYS